MNRRLWLLWLILSVSAAVAASVDMEVICDPPGTNKGFKTDQVFKCDVKIKGVPTTEKLVGGQFLLNFDPAILQVVDQDGNLVTALTPKSPFCLTDTQTGECNAITNSVDNAAGKIDYYAISEPPAFVTASSSGDILVSIHLKGIKGKSSTDLLLQEMDYALNEGSVVQTAVVEADGTISSIFNYPDDPNDPSDGDALSLNRIDATGIRIAPSPPANLQWTNTANANFQADLSWDAVADEAGMTYSYRLFRCTSADGTPCTPTTTDVLKDKLGQEVVVSTTSYSDNTVDWTTGTRKYFYAVAARDDAGAEGKLSDAVGVGPDAWAPTSDPASITPADGSVRVCFPDDGTGTVGWTTDEKVVEARVRISKNSDLSAAEEFCKTIASSKNVSVTVGNTTTCSGAAGTPLEKDVVYHYEIKAKDRAGNESSFVRSDGTATGTPFSFDAGNKPCVKPKFTTAPSCTADTTAKTITCTWETDQESDTQLALNDQTPSDASDPSTYKWLFKSSTLQTSHQMVMKDGDPDSAGTPLVLQEGITYHWRAASNSAPPDPNFEVSQTGTVDYGEKLAVINAAHSNVQANGAVITWTTNLSATSQVSYGRSSSNLDQAEPAEPDQTLVTDHAVSLNNLQCGTKYFYKAISTSGIQTAESSIKSFTTSACAAQPGNLTGKVTSTAGAALSGATVTLNTGLTTTTDANGTYLFESIEALSYQVTASKAGFQSSTKTVAVPSGGTATLDFALAAIDKVGTIVVTVTGKDDQQPIEGVEVVVAELSENNKATTGADGIVSFSVPADTDVHVTASKDGFFPETVVARVQADSVENVSIVLEKAATIKGSLTDIVNNLPVGAVGIFAQQAGQTDKCLFITETKADGTYVLNVKENTYNIVVLTSTVVCDGISIRGLPSGFETPSGCKVEGVENATCEVAAVVGTAKTVDFELIPKFQVDLTTTDASGRTLTSVSVAPGVVLNLTATVRQGTQAFSLTSIDWDHTNTEVGTLTPGTFRENKATATFTASSAGTTDVFVCNVNQPKADTSNDKSPCDNPNNLPTVNAGQRFRITVENELRFSDEKFRIFSDRGEELTTQPVDLRRVSFVDIHFELSQQFTATKGKGVEVTGFVYRQDGKLVGEIIEQTGGTSGTGLRWRLTDRSGNRVPVGVYIVQVVATSGAQRAVSKPYFIGVVR